MSCKDEAQGRKDKKDQQLYFLNTENCLIFASAEGKREVGIVRSLELGV